MLNNISLNNFKCFEGETGIQLRPLTLLSGLNNTGKSSVLQALRMYWKWQKTKDPLLPEHGAISELRNRNAAPDADMSISISTNDHTIYDLLSLKQYDNLTAPTIISFSKLPMLCYLSADRFGPRPYLSTFTSIEKLLHVGEHGEYVIDFLSQHERDIVPPQLCHPAAEGQTLEYNVRAWLGEISPNIKLVQRIERNCDLAFFQINGFRPNNTGFGISYSLPIIVLLLGMACEWQEPHPLQQNGVVILIENPEAHIHPRAQTILSQLIAKVVSCGVQVIVESHSDHILDGIRISVQEGILKPNQVIFHYFDNNNTKTIIQTPEITEKGKLSFWPEGFFDQTLKNRSRLAR